MVFCTARKAVGNKVAKTRTNLTEISSCTIARWTSPTKTQLDNVRIVYFYLT